MDFLTGTPGFAEDADDVLALQSYGSAAETIDCKSMVSCISHPSAIQEEPRVSEVSGVWSPASPAPTDRLA